MCRLFYFDRPAHQDPTPPLYHITKVLACQAFQMLNFCYKCVTKVLQKCYRYVTTYYISITEVLHTVNTSAPYPTIGPGKLQAGTGPPIVPQAGSWKSWKLGAGMRRPAGYCIQAGNELGNQPHASWMRSSFRRRQAGTAHTKNPIAASWNIHIVDRNVRSCGHRIFCRR